MSTAIPLPQQSFSETVARNVRALAAAAGHSQSSLSRALGMSQTQTHKRWKGSIAWTLDELAEVAAVLGVSPAVLIDGFIPDTQNPTRWITPSGAAARSKGLEPPTF
ncbi:helix-turn-helix domain-containing protein [Schaalia vaccimaxillae]|uniref:helix-turn-helix domain-containing protein n=1 Tax=Schaalia vaccimaxillae TaxID=183916 RepID=UPI0009FE47EE|nr:helix-turn-helix domain-containing protein [Schaalia vaccimaxillae]